MNGEGKSMSKELVKIASTAGKIEAEIIRGLLEANGIQAHLSYESAGATYGLGVGPMAEVDILVLAEQQSQAEALLADYYEGRLDDDEPAEA
jgi:hypothetical protein